MLIDKILEYQSADLKLFRLENELKNTEEFKRAALYQKKIAESMETLKKYEQEAADTMSAYDRISENISSAENTVSELLEAVAGIGDDGGVGEYEFYLKKLDKANEALSSLEKEIAKIKRRADEITAESGKLVEIYSKAGAKWKEANVEFNKLAGAKKEEFDTLKKDATAAKSGLSEGLLTAYKALRDAKRVPPFVKLIGKNQCGGCGMDVSYDTLAKIQNAGDYSECPNCHRFLYKVTGE